MSYTELPIIKRLVLSKEAIGIVQNDPVLLARLEAWGYTLERLAVGLEKQAEAARLLEDRNVSYGTGIAATAITQEVRDGIRDTLVDDRNIARVALKRRPGLAQQLRLSGRLDTSREQMLVRAQHFYRKIQELPEVQVLLDPFSLTAAVIAERLERVDALAAAMQDQQHKRAEATVVTRRRKEAMRALDDWMIEFLGAARLAFRKEQEQLRKLGLPAK